MGPGRFLWVHVGGGVYLRLITCIGGGVGMGHMYGVFMHNIVDEGVGGGMWGHVCMMGNLVMCE